MFRLLALDIDDTLLNTRGELSSTNKDAIARAVRAGVTVTVSTGRAYVSAKVVCEQMGISGIPVITFGGAQIVEFPSGKSLFMDLMPVALLKEVCDFAREQEQYIQIYNDEEYLFQRDCDESRYYAGRTGYTGRAADIFGSEFHNSPKALCVLTEATIGDFYQKARKRFEGRARVFQSGPRFIEFCNLGIDKASALAQLGEMLGIASSEMVAMGDNGIDAPMLRYAGLGIAVANATDEAKEAADRVTISADEHAVAHVIDTIILPEIANRS